MITVLFAFVDHFEPEQKPGDHISLQLERVSGWIGDYEERYSSHADCRGRKPQHTYFFPQEQYHPEILDMLAGHCRRKYGEVEIHIHHDNDTPDQFVDKMEEFKEQLAGHGLLPVDDVTGERMYGFIHGNWALDNCRKDGRWCGLNNEITLLRETGCYADFTLPCSPAEGQTKKINSIYFADDDPERPKSHDSGRDIVFGGRDSGDLLLIQGPLMLNWGRKSRGIFPGIENGDISRTNPVSRDRINRWIGAGISVSGRDNVVFVKVHTHGLKPRNTRMLLGEETASAFSLLESEFNDGKEYRLYYVTAREMANVAYAFNDGVDREPVELLDYRLRL